MDKNEVIDNANTDKYAEEVAAAANVVEMPSLSSPEDSIKDTSDEEKKDVINRLISSSDTATVFAHPGLRLVYAFISWIVMGYEVPIGKGFFIASFLFSLSLAFDYGKFSAKSKFRRFTRGFGAWWNAIWAILSFIGILGALSVVKIREILFVKVVHYALLDGVHLRFSIVLLALGFTIVITGVDWYSEKREVEELFPTE